MKVRQSTWNQSPAEPTGAQVQKFTTGRAPASSVTSRPQVISTVPSGDKGSENMNAFCGSDPANVGALTSPSPSEHIGSAVASHEFSIKEKQVNSSL